MNTITLNATYSYWACECRGSGHHITIEVPELKITFSEDDQFGGTLDDSHTAWPVTDCPTYSVEEIERMYISMGYEVNINEEWD